uniref:PARP-type domain-containing protein n=1 Tax=Prymnesium polylepis TaxID=72548 RepID=A0A7S4J936_9EUKA
MPTYCVEYAKSNRSTCKQCKTKIDMGVVRIGTISPGPGDYDITSWRHMSCQKLPKGVTETSAFPGFDSLEAAEKAKLEAWLAAGPTGTGGAKKRTADELDDVAQKDPKKMKPKELDAALKVVGVAKKSKKEKVEAMEEVVERAAAEACYSKMTIPQLKALCEANKQLKGGTKPELVERLVDGKMYGALPRCPDCGGGILKVYYPNGKYGHAGQGKFSCPGYFDDDVWKRCSYTAESAERLPWQDTVEA